MNMSGRKANTNFEESWMDFLMNLNNHLQMVDRVVTKVYPKCHQAYKCDLIKNTNLDNYSLSQYLNMDFISFIGQ